MERLRSGYNFTFAQGFPFILGLSRRIVPTGHYLAMSHPIVARAAAALSDAPTAGDPDARGAVFGTAIACKTLSGAQRRDGRSGGCPDAFDMQAQQRRERDAPAPPGRRR